MRIVVLDGSLIRRRAVEAATKKKERIEKGEEPREPRGLTPSYFTVCTSFKATSGSFPTI